MPKTYFFGDLTSDHEQRFTKNYYLSHPAIIRINSNPGEGVGLRHIFRLQKTVQQVEGQEGTSSLSYGVANATTLKFNSIKDVSQKLKLANAFINYEVGYKPSEHNNDERTVQLKHVSKYAPSSGRLDNTETLKVGFPKMGPIRSWFTLDFAWNTEDQKKLAKQSLSFNYGDYHLGYKLEHNLTDLKSLVTLLALKNNKGDFFLKAEPLKEVVTVGCNHSHSDRAHHSIELSYDNKAESKGCCGMPVGFNFGGEYNLSQDITLKTKLTMNKNWNLGVSWIHRFDKNLKLVFSDDVNLCNLVQKPNQTNYNFGLLLEWSI